MILLEQLLYDVGGETSAAGPGGAGGPEHEMVSALDIRNENLASCGHSRFERGPLQTPSARMRHEERT
jgi:hypothetical protein